MDLSIIIVNWNTREMLRDCIASVAERLGALRAEIWVVDNGSEDGSPDMVRTSFPDVKLIANAENWGFAAANNQALRLATGRHILLLNSDTLVHGDTLAASVAFLDKTPTVGGIGCRVLNVDGSLQITCSRFPSLLNLALQSSGLNRLPGAFFDRYQMTRWDRRDAREVEVVSGCYLMVRRAAMEEVGLLDESFFFYGEETDWCRRFRNADWTLMLAPVGEITHFGGGSVKSFSHRRDVMLTAGIVRLHRKHFGVLGGLACWALLAGFNLSRAFAWSLLGMITSGPARKRGAHFRRVAADLPGVWPRQGI